MKAIRNCAEIAYFRPKIFYFRITQPFGGFCKAFSQSLRARAGTPSLLADKAIINAVEFSHAYLFFYGQLEKANLMLQGVIDNASKPLDDVRMQFFFKNPINDHARESSLRGQRVTRQALLAEGAQTQGCAAS